MSRSYTLRKRAEQQAQTRRRIVEAAVELHQELGPARTPLSLIAERAGVQRKTLYAHFPDERSVQLACSGLTLERDPPPDPADWRGITEPDERLRTGLLAIYAWYRRNAGLFASVLRDAEYHKLTRETVELRFQPTMARIGEVLADGLAPEQQALLRVAMDFATWRTLAQAGTDDASAADILVRAIGSLGGRG